MLFNIDIGDKKEARITTHEALQLASNTEYLPEPSDSQLNTLVIASESIMDRLYMPKNTSIGLHISALSDAYCAKLCKIETPVTHLSTESINSSNAFMANVLSNEESTSLIGKIWNSIKSFFKAIKDWIVGLFTSNKDKEEELLNDSEKIKERIEVIKTLKDEDNAKLASKFAGLLTAKPTPTADDMTNILLNYIQVLHSESTIKSIDTAVNNIIQKLLVESKTWYGKTKGYGLNNSTANDKDDDANFNSKLVVFINKEVINNPDILGIKSGVSVDYDKVDQGILLANKKYIPISYNDTDVDILEVGSDNEVSNADNDDALGSITMFELQINIHRYASKQDYISSIKLPILTKEQIDKVNTSIKDLVKSEAARNASAKVMLDKLQRVLDTFEKDTAIKAPGMSKTDDIAILKIIQKITLMFYKSIKLIATRPISHIAPAVLEYFEMITLESKPIGDANNPAADTGTANNTTN